MKALHQSRGAQETARVESCGMKRLLLLVLMASACKSNGSHAHHVLIAYPEHWLDGERRPCFLGPEDGTTVSGAMGQAKLPQLDCDRFVQGELIHRTPAERIFALDVDFGGDFYGALESRRAHAINETPWTCERIGEKIACKP
jgi:hypothetical protein